jgi:hypothetical protein
LGILILLFGVADGFFIQAKKEVESSANISVAVGSTGEISALQASSTQFNSLVTLVSGIQNGLHPEGIILGAVQAHASASNVTMSHMTITGYHTPITFSGVAPTTDDISSFKSAMTGDPLFSAVEAPLSSVQPSGNAYSFSMTFVYNGI